MVTCFKVIQGLHSPVWGGQAVTVEQDGIKHEYPYNTETTMKDFFVEPLIDDVGLSESWREPAREYLLKRIQERREITEDEGEYITVGEACEILNTFADGWEACQKSK